MELLQYLLPNPNLLNLQSYEMDLENRHLTISVSSAQTTARCPLCGRSTQRIHSRYQRTLADLPCLDFSLIFLVEVCKFFCLNSECRRRIFTERIPEIVAPWGRKTVRQVQRLQAIALALGGAAGSHLGNQLGYFSCGSSLLNYLQRIPLPNVEVPKILGVDDFAFRKGHQYGTILVNLETNKPIALLKDRKADTLADWLRDHPGVEILSRDRSKAYKSAMDKAAPDATQVADRFHLVKNLSDTLENILKDYRSELKAIEQENDPVSVEKSDKIVIVTPKPTATINSQKQILTKHQDRLERQRQIKALCKQQWSTTAIAKEVGVSVRTVRRYIAQPDLPELPTRRPTFGRSLLDPYKPEIVAWWNSEIMDSNLLMSLLQEKGYQGSLRTLQRYLAGLREAQGLRSARVRFDKLLPKVVDTQSLPLTPSRAAYLIVLKEENREPQEMELLNKLVRQHPNLANLVDLAHEFLQLLRQRQVEAFDDWLNKALGCQIQPLKHFAAGLMKDYAAVKASIMMEVSNGPVEGLNNRLKMLKRQMYGRAGLELLTKRFVMAR